MIADVIIIHNPTEEQQKAGALETILAPQKQYVGRSADAIKMAAIIDNTFIISAEPDASLVEILVRPF